MAVLLGGLENAFHLALGKRFGKELASGIRIKQ